MTLESVKCSGEEVTAARTRVFTGRAGKALWWFNVLFALYVFTSLSGILEYFGIFIYVTRYDAIFLMYILAMTYLNVPATKGASRTGIPWYDVIAILLSVMVCGYIAIIAPEVPKRLTVQTSYLENVFGLIAIALVLEGVRRTIGLSMALMGVIFFIYPFVSSYLPGFLYSVNLELDRVIQFQYVYPYGLFGNLLHIFSSTVAPFLIFGAFVIGSGAGNFFIDLATAVLGHFRGGPAKIAVVASSLFGAVSGSPSANACTTGVITIPMMKRLGYPPHFAAAVEAVASEGGQIMPPVLGAAAFIMMELLNVSYLAIAKAALIPALLYYFALFLMLDLNAAKTGIKGLKREELPRIKPTIKAGWPYVIPIATLLILIGPLRLSPQTASILATLTVIACTWMMKGRGMGPRRVADGLVSGMNSLPSICIIMEVAAILVGVFELTSLSFNLTSGMIALAGGNKLILVLLAAVAALIIGLALPTSAVYLMTAILVAPSLIKVGVLPIVAHFYGWYYGLAAAISPPVAITCFITAGIAGADYMKTQWVGCRLGIVIFIVPLMLAYSPELLMIGEPLNIALAIITALLGIVLLSAGLERYFLVHSGWPQSILFFIAGVALMVPGLATDIVGLALGAIAATWQWMDLRRIKSRAQT